MAQALKFGKGVWATKTGSSMAYSDTNDRYKPLPFNVERDSIATRVNKEGLIEVVGHDKLRIDYTDTDKGVALLEPSRSNLFPYSEDFESSDWTKNAGTTITNNYAISPDGTLNASRYLGTGASGLGDKFTLSATDYTISFWVKSNTSQNQFCRIIIDSSNVSDNIEVTTEWKRITFTAQGSGLSNKTNGIFRDSYDNDIDILIYGAQLEQGNLSSYIPTSGSAVTRAADVANNAGNSEVFNDSEGVLFANIAALANSGNGQIRINEQGVLNSVIMEFRDSGTTLRTYIFDGNATNQFFSETNINPNDNIKIALKYKQNDCSLYLNGFVTATDTTATMPSNLNSLSFEQGDGNNYFYGKTKEIGYYDAVLTDSELEYLTSYRSLSELVKELNLNTL